MNTFKRGDLIKQKHQVNAPVRLVVSITDNSEVVKVHDPEQGVINVFAWGHELVKPADDASLQEASTWDNVPAWEKS